MFRYFIALFLLVFIATPVGAQQEKNATLDVFSSKSAVQAGDEFDIAIRQNIRDGWHTYWKNAGDSGEPISIEWDAPKGIEISDIRFPTPKEINYDPLVNYGYEGAPIYLQTVSVADDFEGDEITLEGDAFWLVCEEICIPEEQEVSLMVAIGENGKSVNNAVFERAENAMPQSVEWEAALSRQDQTAILTIQAPKDLQNQFTDVEIYPYDWGIMVTNEPALADIREDGEVVFSKGWGNRDFAELMKPQFVIKTANESYLVTASANPVSDVVADSPAPFILIILFAFIGGLILNLMPCVFPVLSMKALSLVKLSAKERRHAQASGIAYTAGIIVSFLIIAGLLIALKAAGATIGWGFQLQNPYVVTGLAALLFIIGLNLIGLFEVTGRWANYGSRHAQGTDVKSSFFTGVLACLVATPCTAPFMASALGYALTQSAFVSLIVFAVLGFGLAFPYLLLCFVPKFQKILPKPGAWMETFRQVLAFPMFASVIWLVWVLSHQAGDLAVLYVLGLFLSIIFLIWLWKRQINKSVKIIALIVLFGGLIIYAPVLSTVQTPTHVSFTQSRLEKALAENPDRPVFVNMTAAWCITCLVNERTSLSKDTVKQAFEDRNVLYIKGDWTNRDAEITQYLESYGRNGVPLYVYYGQADGNGDRPDPEILPQILTPSIVINTLKGDK